MLGIKKFWEGLRIVAKATLSSDTKGELEVDNSSGKLNYHNGTTRSPVVTESHSAVLTNKSIDGDDNTISDLQVTSLKAGVLNTSTSLAGASNTQIPSALAVKTYVDNNIAGHDAASEISYDNTTSGLSATNVQDAIDQVDALIVNHIADTTDAHAASSISNTPAGTISSTTVQAALNELDGDIQGHITNATGAHAATAISVTPTGNLSSITVQAGLVELQGDINTINSGLAGFVTGPASATDNHLVRFDGTTGKLVQDGSPAVLSDAGGLSGLTQLDSDNLRLDGNIISSTDTNGNVIVTPNGTGVLQSTKNAQFDALINFASANDAATGSNATLTAPTTKVIRLTNASLVSVDGVPSGTSARELIIENATGTSVVINEDTGATAANRFYTGTTAGITLADKASLYLSYDSTASRWRVIGGSGSGTGSQVPDVFVQLDASELLSVWSTGNNASFLGGGSLSGTFAKETTAPLNGTASYKFTQAAGSLNDYLASSVQSVPVRFRGNICTFLFPYVYNGGNSDIEPIVYDVTNSTKLTISSNLLPASATTGAIYKANILIPSTCTQVRVGFQVKILNSGKVLSFDDIQLSSDTTRYSTLNNNTDWVAATFITLAMQGLGTITNNLQMRREGANLKIRGAYTFGTVTTSAPQLLLPSWNGVQLVSAPAPAIAALSPIGRVLRSAASANVDINYTTSTSRNYIGMSNFIVSTSANPMTELSNTSANFGTGDVHNIQGELTIPISGWVSSNPNILTAVDTFSSDTAALTYASSSSYTLTTLSDAPIGTFITFTTAINSNTLTQTTTAPTQTTTDMNTNGVRLFCRAYNAASTAGNPARIAMQIGKGLKATSLNLYKSTGKVLAGRIDYHRYASGGTPDVGSDGIYFKDYNEVTGILVLDAGTQAASNTIAQFLFIDVTSQTDGYVTINASKSPALVGITSGVWAVRAVNTSGTSIANSGDTKVALDASATFSSNLTVDSTNNRISAGTAGIFEVSGAIQFASSLYAAGNAIELRIYKNGTYYSTLSRVITEVASTQIVGVSGNDLIQLVATDYIEFFANNNRTAGATALVTTAGANFFTVNKLGGL